MRTLISLILTATFIIGSCQKDPEVTYNICKPGDRPEVSDSIVDHSLNEITGNWELINTLNYGNEAFLKYSIISQAKKRDTKDSLTIHFREQNNEVFASGLINDCRGNYRLSLKGAKIWLHIKKLGCTLLPASGQDRWEEKYFKAVDNATCVEIEKEKLTLHYYINEDKKGKLIYEKVN